MEQFKNVIQLDEQGYFMGNTQAQLSIDEVEKEQGIYLMPQYSIDAKEPKFKDGFIAKWDGKDWDYKENHVGKIAYSTETGKEVKIKEVGELPNDLTFESKLSQYHTWNGKQWIITEENKAKQLEDEKQAKLAENQNKLDANLDKAQKEIAYLERKKARGKASKDDLDLLEKLYDLEDDLRDIAKLGINENSEIPNLPTEVQA